MRCLRLAPSTRTFAGAKYHGAVYQLTVTESSEIDGRAGSVVRDYRREVPPAL